MALEIVATAGAPAAVGPYSQAVKVGSMLYTAGQIPLDPVTMKVVDGDITAQAERVMANLAAVLEAGGSSLQRVVKTTCFVTDLADYAAFNAVYGKWLGDHKPARSTVQVAKLPLGVMVEVEAVALVE